MAEPPEFLTTEQVQANVEITPKTEIALIGDRIYKREGRQWRLLMQEVELHATNNVTQDG